jgi:hypothetical protein
VLVGSEAPLGVSSATLVRAAPPIGLDSIPRDARYTSSRAMSSVVVIPLTFLGAGLRPLVGGMLRRLPVRPMI